MTETEVPNTILWIASVGLIILTVLMAGILITMLAILGKVKKLINKAQEIIEPLKEAAENAGNTVSTFSNSMLRPLATALGAMAGFRKGASRFGGKKK